MSADICPICWQSSMRHNFDGTCPEEHPPTSAPTTPTPDRED